MPVENNRTPPSSRLPVDQGPPTLYAFLTERAILQLFDLAMGGRIVPLFRERLRHQALAREQLDALQGRRIARMLLHCWDHVPFYRERFQQAGLRRNDLEQPGALSQIPVLRKREVIEHHQRMVDTSRPRKMSWTTTGGSTGETVRLCFDRLANNSIKAREIRAHRWWGIHEGERVARLWGSPIDLRDAYTPKNRLLRRIKNVLFLDGYNLTEAAMHDYVRRLRAFRPRLLIGFTSCLNVFGEFLEAQGVTDVRPHAVSTTASPLYPKYRKLFQRIFDCPVYDCYGSREFGGISHECPAHEGQHVSMEDVHLCVEVDGRPAPEGQAGELIVTGLYNDAMPLVRYAIKDQGRLLPGVCSCGMQSQRLEVLLGRTSEMLMGPRGIPVMGEYFIDLFDALPGQVLRFRVYQEARTRLAIHLVAPRPLSESSRTYVLKSIGEKFGEEMQVEFQYLDELPPLPSGKHLLTINNAEAQQ